MTRIWPMIAVTAIYSVQAFMLLSEGRPAGALILVGYVIANVGLMLTL